MSTTAANAAEGFFQTGDLGYMDQVGRVYLTGRATEFINVAGNKVDPYEVESLLKEHHNIQDVAVVGIPTHSGTERVKAFVVLNEACSSNVLHAWCADRCADYKVPRLWQRCDEIPKSPLGKVLRGSLRNLPEELLNES